MNRSAFSALALAGALVLPLAQTAQAAVTTTADLVAVTDNGGGSWSFTSGGWFGGGTMAGSFAGSDGNSDGQLSSFDGEVTGFGAAYSGGTIVGGVSFVFGDLFGLVYDLNGGPLGDGVSLDVEGIGAAGGGASFSIGPGPVGLCGIGSTCGSITGPDAVVSEPPLLPLMVVGLALFAAVRRRAR